MRSAGVGTRLTQLRKLEHTRVVGCSNRKYSRTRVDSSLKTIVRFATRELDEITPHHAIMSTTATDITVQARITK